MRLIFTLCFFLLLDYVFPQGTAIVTGRITDSETKKALAGATVYTDKNTGVISDKKGNYYIQLRGEKTTLYFRYIGYTPVSQTVDLAPGDTVTLDIFLEFNINLLNEIVISAGKFEQKLSDVTVSMEVLKPRKIVSTNTTSMEMILDQMPGIDILDGQPNIRGGSGYSYGAGSRVLVLVDDLPVLSADAGDVKWNFIPVENISRVEIIKGASSVLYGSSALNGVINIRTAFPQVEPETSITGFCGLYMNPAREEIVWWDKQPLFYGTHFLHSRKINNLDLVIGGNLFKDPGYRELEYDRWGRGNVNLKYSDRKIKGLAYGVNTNIMFQDKSDFLIWQNADSGAYKQNPDAISELSGFRLKIDPYISYYNPKGDTHSLKTRFFRIRNKFLTTTDKDNFSSLFYAEYKFQKKFRQNFNWTIGISGTYSSINANLFGDHNSSNLAVYSQIDCKIIEKLKISFGMRWEGFKLDHSTSSSIPILRTGLNYQIGKYSYLRASFGQGYRYPSVAEKFTATQVGSLNIFPNSDLKSETGWSTEIGLKQGIRISDWNGYFDIAGFWTEYQDMIEFTFGVYAPDSVPYPTLEHVGFKSLNIGNARIRGAEITLTGTGKLFGLETDILAGYTYLDATDLTYETSDTTNISGSDFLKYRYRHSVKGDIEFKYKNVSFGLTVIYHSLMENIDRVFLDPLTGSMILPGFAKYWEENNTGYIVFDNRISYQFNDYAKLSIVTRNIFNREYMGRPGDIRPPRNITLQLSVNF
jgi:outer membrane cobalamin receptor